MDSIPSNLTPDCPPPSVYEKTEKISEKNYKIKSNEKEYDLIISLYNNNYSKSEKIFNFKLIEPYESFKKLYSYESDKSTTELIKLFLINISQNQNIDKEKKIFEKIEKFHINNNVQIISKNTDNMIDLIYILKTYDDEDIKFVIELTKKNDIDYKEKNQFELINEIQELKYNMKKMEQKYDELKEEVKILKNQLNLLYNNGHRAILIKEEDQLIFKSDLSLLNSIKKIDAEIDGGRGVNDYFEPFHLKNDESTVYIAVKCKEESSDISNIDVIKMSSINDIKKIKSLSGHQKRIVFIKYFKNPYTLQEYLISGDREEIVRAWEIIDENNFQLLCVIKTNYGRLIMQQSIYNCLIYFTENRSYIITTTVTNNYSRLYDLENGSLIKDISLTYYNYTFYLIRYKEYIIDCCKNFVMIYNPINEEVYSKIENSYTKGDNRSCCIIYNKNDNDYLYISNSNGYIIEYCLNTKVVMYNFDINKDLYHIIFWDLNNLIIAQYNSEYLGLVDIKNKNIKNLIKCRKTFMCVKKILLNKNNEILLASGEDSTDIFVIFASNTPISSNVEKI